jgi:hypothetical protein
LQVRQFRTDLNVENRDRFGSRKVDREKIETAFSAGGARVYNTSPVTSRY